jgi:hypothetical protein
MLSYGPMLIHRTSGWAFRLTSDSPKWLFFMHEQKMALANQCLNDLFVSPHVHLDIMSARNPVTILYPDLKNL